MLKSSRLNDCLFIDIFDALMSIQKKKKIVNFSLMLFLSKPTIESLIKRTLTVSNNDVNFFSLFLVDKYTFTSKHFHLLS